MCCPFFSVVIAEKIICLKGNFRLVVSSHGSAQITHENEVYIPEGDQMISWKDIFEDKNPYFIGARIRALYGTGSDAVIELTLAVIESGACTSHTVMFRPKIGCSVVGNEQKQG